MAPRTAVFLAIAVRVVRQSLTTTTAAILRTAPAVEEPIARRTKLERLNAGVPNLLDS